jgi:hypothetical protein
MTEKNMFDWLWGRKRSSRAKTTAEEMAENAKGLAGTSQEMLANVEAMLQNCETMLREAEKLPDGPDKDEVVNKLKLQSVQLLTMRHSLQHQVLVIKLDATSEKLLADHVR